MCKILLREQTQFRMHLKKDNIWQNTPVIAGGRGSGFKGGVHFRSSFIPFVNAGNVGTRNDLHFTFRTIIKNENPLQRK